MLETNKNNLSEDSSPYLQQHKKNPVNWQVWSQDVLDFAKKKKIPIIVGGTGLYFNTITKGISKIPDIDIKTRNKVRNFFQKLGFVKFLYKKTGLPDFCLRYEHVSLDWPIIESDNLYIMFSTPENNLNEKLL